MFEQIDGYAVPECYCTVCGGELELYEDGHVCAACWVDIKEGLYERAIETTSKSETDRGIK